jgi:hypothetical protein
MSLTDMIVKPAGGYDEAGINSWTVKRGSRTFLIVRNARGDWEVVDLGAGSGDVLDVSGDLSGSLEYIESLFT